MSWFVFTCFLCKVSNNSLYFYSHIVPLKFKDGKNTFLQSNAFYIMVVGRSQPAFTCSKLKIEALEKGVKYAQS